jgi:hypothetical protein
VSKIKWKKPIANFQNDLNFGRIGELAFLHASKGTLEPLDGRNGDMKIIKNNLKLELKVDKYDHSKTENFFIERFSYGNKPGGVFRAMEDGSDFLAYYFQNPGFLYLFRTVELMARVQEIQHKFTLIDIPNTTHITRGYKIPRHFFQDLEVSPDEAGFKFDSSEFEWFRRFNKASL